MASKYSDAAVAALKAEYESANQGHVFKFWDELSQEEKVTFFEQLSNITPSEVNFLRDLALNPPPEPEETTVEPLPAASSASLIDADDKTIQGWRQRGLKLIGESKVAVVLLAGGQGTRLQFPAPKGCFDIKLPSHKSLFQLQAERIQRVKELAAREVGKSAKDVGLPWYVMTSGPTQEDTDGFFKGTACPAPLEEAAVKTRKSVDPYFGLPEKDVTLFQQGVLPCIAPDGKFMLESKGKVAEAPDGNGGIYKALLRPFIETDSEPISIVQDMKNRGVEHVYAYCVDNCLAKVADPVFIGFAAEKQVQIATKVVRKDNPKESVGLIMQKNGRPAVVEYSELDDATAEAQDPSNPQLLKFRAANIVNHYYTIAMLEKKFTLPPHVAKKAIPCIDLKTGEKIKPESKNGIKLEQFIFDNFKELSLDEFASFEVDRKEEFSPLKNKDGEDSPETSYRDIMLQGKRWLEAAGATIGEKLDGVEVPPMVSYDGEGLSVFKGETISESFVTLEQAQSLRK